MKITKDYEGLKDIGWAYELQGDLTRSDIDDEINRVKKIVSPHRLNQRLFNKHSKFSHKVVNRFYGTWNHALDRNGIRTVTRKYSREELFLNMKKVWDMLGRQPTYNEMNSDFSEIGPSSYERMFGSFKKSLIEFCESQSCSSKEDKLIKVEILESNAIELGLITER